MAYKTELLKLVYEITDVSDDEPLYYKSAKSANKGYQLNNAEHTSKTVYISFRIITKVSKLNNKGFENYIEIKEHFLT